MHDLMNNQKNYTIIESNKRFKFVDWSELWKYRELFYIFVWRDIKVRYRQTFLGIGWAIFQPFITMIVFTLFFGMWVRVPSDGIPYPIFVYAGLLPWMLFSNGLNRASMSLLNESNIIGKIYFPRLIIPISSFGVGILDFIISFILLLIMMFYYDVKLTGSLLILPLLLISTLLAAIGISIWLSALTVTYRDVKYISPFLIQIWMYATPIIYPVSVVPQEWKWILLLNPLSSLIDSFRSALFEKPFDWLALVISLLISITVFVLSLFYFKKVEYRFADII